MIFSYYFVALYGFGGSFHLTFWRVWLEVYQFCWLFQRISSWFHWSVLLFFKLLFHLFLLSSLFTSFNFVLSLAPLGRRLGWLGFFLLLQVGLYCYKPLSSNHFCCIPKILNHSLCFHLSPCIFYSNFLVDPLFTSMLFNLQVFMFFQDSFLQLTSSW